MDPAKREFIELDIALSNGQPLDIAIDAANGVWFTEIGANNIGRLDISNTALKGYQPAKLSVELNADQRKMVMPNSELKNEQKNP